MALYALGDFHLSFSVDKPMDIYGDEWKNHEEKIEDNCKKLIRPKDTIVITGDHSWGRNMDECEKDLAFISALPGRKILLRGNHVMFWDAKKTERLNQYFDGKLYFLQNNFYTYKDYALIGTKGYCYEGKDSIEHYQKIMKRELERLQCSFDKASAAGYHKFLMFLHYPPTTIGEKESGFTRLANEYGVEKVIYSHCHGKERFNDSYKGMVNGIEYRLVSADYLNFCPELLKD